MLIKLNHIPIPVSEIAESIFFPDKVKMTVKEYAKEKVQEAIIGSLEGVAEILVELIDSIALVGGGLCILFWVAGWTDAKKWLGVLVLADVLVKYLLGGAA